MKTLTVLWWLSAAAVFGYLSLAAGMWFMQDKLIYYPYRDVQTTPADIGLSYQDVRFRSQDGVALHAWYLPPPDDDAPVLLFAHGNAGNISHRLDSLKQFHQLGLGVLIFDYRGYGRSGGKPSEAGLYRDALAAYEQLVGPLRVEPSRIFALGRSLGGAVAAYIAANRPVSGLILDATFTDLRDLGAALYPYLPVRRLSRNHFPTRQYLLASEAPTLIFHGDRDTLVPVAHAHALRDAAGARGRFVLLQGGHEDAHLISREAYDRALLEFVRAARPD